MTDILALDTETSGLVEPEVVELGWVIIDEKAHLIPNTQYEAIVNPGVPISCGAAGVHGIRNEVIEEGDYPVIADLPWPKDPVILVCHNLAFDEPLVADYLNIADRMCTYVLARRLLPDCENHKLPTLSCWCDLPQQENHRALGDVMDMIGLLRYMMAGCGWDFWEMLDFYKEDHVLTKYHMAFGKHKDEHISNVPSGYLKWALNNMDLDRDMKTTFQHYVRL